MLTAAEADREVRSHVEGAVQALVRLQDFHVFTGYSYGVFKEMVAAGNHTAAVVNGRTSSSLSAQELAPVLLAYLDDDLPRVVLYEAVAQFEALFFDTLKILLRFNPRALSPKRQITVDDVLTAASLPELVHAIVDRELGELQYKAPSDWFAFLDKVIGLDLPDADVQRLAELKATRDLYLHNRGRVNSIYLRKAGSLARAKMGAKLPVGRPYVYGGLDFLKTVAARLAEAVTSRLAPAPSAP